MMTHEQSRLRGLDIRAAVLGGMPAKAAAARWGVSLETVKRYAWRTSLGAQQPRQTPKPPVIRKHYTRKQQKANQAEAAQAHREWRKQHILLCASFAGPCCKDCHASPSLEILLLAGGDYAYICCKKAQANGLLTQAAIDRRGRRKPNIQP